MLCRPGVPGQAKHLCWCGHNGGPSETHFLPCERGPQRYTGSTRLGAASISDFPYCQSAVGLSLAAMTDIAAAAGASFAVVFLFVFSGWSGALIHPGVLSRACWYAIPHGLCLPRLQSGGLFGSPRVLCVCFCALAVASLCSVSHPHGCHSWPAPRVVPVQGTGRAVPTTLCPSAFPVLFPALLLLRGP